jgi:phytoene dehydrogenase-like protein
MSSLNHKQEKKTLNVAVVGAGLSGLTAAHQLTAGGARVTIFERNHKSGGRAQTLTRDGFHLNLGPHALYKGGEAYQFLASLNMVPRGAEPQFTRALASFDGETFDLPVTPEAIQTTKLMNPDEMLEFVQLNQSLFTTNWDAVMNVPLEKWLETNIKSDRVRTIVESFARLNTYGNNPKQMSAGAVFKQLVLGMQGVLYLDNGWTSIVEALETTLDSVEFRYGHAVDSVESVDDGIQITVNGDRLLFDAVVLAVPPDAIRKMIPSAIPPSVMQNIVPSKAACLDVCLKKLPVPDNTFAIGIDEPLYLSVHSNSAKLAPDGGAMIHLAVYLGPENGTHENEIRLLKLLDTLQPGWQDEVVFKRFLPNMNASFGTPMAALNGANGLETPEVAHEPGVFIAGDFVGTGAMLADASVKSAIEAARLILSSNGGTEGVLAGSASGAYAA